MKKIAVVVLMFVLLMIFAFIAPVIAEAPTITSFKAIQSGTTLPPEKVWTTNGDIRQGRGIVNQGNITFYVPATATSPKYIFKFYNVYDSTANFTDSVSQPITVRVNATWNYIVNGVVLGAFEGQIEWNLKSPHVAHGLLQGTGVFEGQTLRFWEQEYRPTVWLGTLMER